MTVSTGSTTSPFPELNSTNDPALERQRHQRQNQEIIRLCSLKSIQARQLQEKLSHLERDNLDLRLALGRKDREVERANLFNHHKQQASRTSTHSTLVSPYHSHPVLDKDRDYLHKVFPQRRVERHCESGHGQQQSPAVAKKYTSSQSRNQHGFVQEGCQTPVLMPSLVLGRALEIIETQQHAIVNIMQTQQSTSQLLQDMLRIQHTSVSKTPHGSIHRDRLTDVLMSRSHQSPGSVNRRPSRSRGEAHLRSPRSYKSPHRTPTRGHRESHSMWKSCSASITPEFTRELNVSPMLVIISPSNDHRFHPKQKTTPISRLHAIVGETDSEMSSVTDSTACVRPTIQRPSRVALKTVPNIDMLPMIEEGRPSLENARSLRIPPLESQSDEMNQHCTDILTAKELSVVSSSVAMASQSGRDPAAVNQPVTSSRDPDAANRTVTSSTRSLGGKQTVPLSGIRERGAVPCLPLVESDVSHGLTDRLTKESVSVTKPSRPRLVSVSDKTMVKKSSSMGGIKDSSASGSSDAKKKSVNAMSKVPSHDSEIQTTPSTTRGADLRKHLSPSELLKKMNKKLLGRSKTPLLKSTPMASTLTPAGSRSVWTSKSIPELVSVGRENTLVSAPTSRTASSIQRKQPVVESETVKEPVLVPEQLRDHDQLKAQDKEAAMTATDVVVQPHVKQKQSLPHKKRRAPPVNTPSSLPETAAYVKDTKELRVEDDGEDEPRYALRSRKK
ncbi:hypothetical protein BG004_002280 [Podila humilis]|nr:hypothetical protein BG004_002280 [Podila humilis]